MSKSQSLFFAAGVDHKVHVPLPPCCVLATRKRYPETVFVIGFMFRVEHELTKYSAKNGGTSNIIRKAQGITLLSLVCFAVFVSVSTQCLGDWKWFQQWLLIFPNTVRKITPVHHFIFYKSVFCLHRRIVIITWHEEEFEARNPNYGGASLM